ncbi:MAG: tetratricopeptide repeat protein [Halanaerobiales bacterium]|nr:tetratricopeptide repeat protein [Halanaerobiales bacterium]
MNQGIKEIEKFLFQAEAEFKLGHYHLVVGNLMFALHLLEPISREKFDLMVKIYLLLIKSHLEMKHITKAHEMWKKGYCLCDKKDNYTVAEFYNLQGKLYSTEKKYFLAIQSYMTTLNLLANDISELSILPKITAMFNIATCHMRKGDYSKAKNAYNETIELLKYYESDSIKGRTFMGLGTLYHFQGEINISKQYYEKSLKLLSPNTDPIVYGLLLHNLAELELSRGQIKNARKLYKKGLGNDLLNKHYKQVTVSCYLGIAKTYVDDDPTLVKEYCKNALNLAMEGLINRFAPREERDLGRIFLLISQILYIEGEKEKSRIYLNQAKSIIKKYNMRNEEIELNELKSKFKEGGD